MTTAWNAGDHDLARSEARDHEPVPQAPRLSPRQCFAAMVTGQLAWHESKAHAVERLALGMAPDSEYVRMRDAWIVWRLGRDGGVGSHG
jgi:hypothetical protein